MVKTASPGSISVPGVPTSFAANAMPDPFDERDFEYRPRLAPLPPVLDQRDDAKAFFVMHQKGNSCTGHAVAAVVNTVLARAMRAAAPQPAPGRKGRAPAPSRVSPYMLYRLARRYDDYPGQEDAGSSLRGALKGWFYHGVALEKAWPNLVMDPEPDLDDPAFAEACSDRPLGAFYRVSPYRLDDMQSAINELHAIAVSAVIHDGWAHPVAMTRNGETLTVIRRDVNAAVCGGHAFALVGYNAVGFLVQNSWGTKWGKGGFATLPYEDWLDCAYDAWVVRPGVPQTPFASGRTSTAVATGRRFAIGPGPDFKRLAMHVVNLGNDGLLSTDGKFASTPAQIDRAFVHMERWHDFWRDKHGDDTRRIVLYAHGGLVSEADGLATAQKHLNWWLNNRLYPLSFAWQSGPAETLVDQLVDSIKGRLPFGGIGFDLQEQFDRLVEKVARTGFSWMWEEMKKNARAASDAIAPEDAVKVQWPPTSIATQDAMFKMPGASLTVLRLADYLAAHNNVAVHLVSHSAGSIFHAALLQRLMDAGIPVASLSLLAPAIRVDEFQRDILPHLGPGLPVTRFATFAMTDQRELNDVCGANGVNVYQKSLLYLVSRALERPGPGDNGEVPLLGMQKFFDRPLVGGQTLAAAIAAAGGVAIFAPSVSPDDSRSDASSHGGFDDDPPSMTSVLMRALGATNGDPQYDYQANAPLREEADMPPIDALPLPAPDAGAAGLRAAAPVPLMPTVETHPPGSTPVSETAPPQRARPVPPPQGDGIIPEVAVAPRSGSPVMDVLQAVGWRPVASADADASDSSTPARSKRPKSPRRGGT
jgi:hypothetical protein